MSGEIEELVIESIRKRRDAGRAKYGTTMERTDLTNGQWITHAQEEALDLAIYLEKLKQVTADNTQLRKEVERQSKLISSQGIEIMQHLDTLDRYRVALESICSQDYLTTCKMEDHPVTIAGQALTDAATLERKDA